MGVLIITFASLFAIISKNELSVGYAALSISQSFEITKILFFLIKSLSDFEVNMTSVERIKEYCEIEQEPEWSSRKEKKPRNTWPDKGNIKIEKYYLKYRENLDYALNNLNIEINGGDKIGIVGRTGAGKSTISVALLRMIENCKGNIFIDNVNINSLGLHDLRHKLNFLPQVSQLIKINSIRIVITKAVITWELSKFYFASNSGTENFLK